MEFVILDEKEFDKFAIKHPLSNFLQSSKQIKIAKLNYWESVFVGIKKNNKIVGASRLMRKMTRLKKYYYYAPRGPLLNYEDEELLNFFTKEIKKYIKENNGYVLVMDPEIIHKERDIDGNVVEDGINNEHIIKKLEDLGYKHGGLSEEYDYSRQIRWIFALDVKDKTEEELLKDLRPNHRNIINRTKKYNIEVEEITKENLHVFKKITEDTSNRRGFNDRSLQYYETLYDEYVKTNNAKFLVAFLNTKSYHKQIKEELKHEENKHENLKDKTTGKAKEQKITITSLKKRLKEAKELTKISDKLPLSAALFIMHNKEIIYLFSGSYDEYMHFFAQYAIQWYMINYAIKNNFEKYNFYGISGNFDKKDPEYGVYEFKKGFSGYVEEYLGSFDLIISPLHYYLKQVLDKIRK